MARGSITRAGHLSLTVTPLVMAPGAAVRDRAGFVSRTCTSAGTKAVTTARRLFEELRERGYPGGGSVVKKYVHKLREAFPHDDPPRKNPSVRDVTSWITRHPDSLNDNQVQRLKAVLDRCPALDRIARHVRTFAELMNNRQGRDLDQWIAPDSRPSVRSTSGRSAS